MSATEKSYPDPDINLETEAYWAAANDGKLLLKSCASCGKTHFYPRAICPHCFSPETDWFEAAGTGRIYSFSIMRRTQTPYVIAYVTLDEGVTMMSNLVDCDFETLAIGQKVELTFRKSEGGQAIPVFRPAGG